ncbi:MAG: protein kinase, partial [Proteobacteria bacterium]|nr:protein kinase [Pseudomonadota bacterium]
MTQLELTDRVLGYGSYATVHEVIYNGRKCAGKEIHKLLQEQGSTSYTLRRFEEECHILSCLHHPNIVQFHGVYFRESKGVPILIMEFLPMNLTSCIEERGVLPEEISYSILHGVTLGLCYLHHQDPPIIHRDLSANNVLLTYDMEAKISDFGVARMLNLTPLQVSHMTETPGTPAYMPPEVMVANPVYDTSVDEFSFGILMIHIFSGKWPEPQCSPIRIEDGKMIPVSEAQRRDVFLQVIGYSHPLMELILKCVSNDPQQRFHVDLILKILEIV